MENEKNENSFTKKIGRKTFKVKIYFSKNSKQTFREKILRLLKNDVAEISETKNTEDEKSKTD